MDRDFLDLDGTRNPQKINDMFQVLQNYLNTLSDINNLSGSNAKSPLNPELFI